MSANQIFKNIQEHLRLKKPIRLVPDTRANASSGFTARYQLELNIPDQRTFDVVRAKLFLLIEPEVKEKINDNEWRCHLPPNISPWYKFGQRSGNYSIFYPAEFTQPGTYKVNHAVAERLFAQPQILGKPAVLSLINSLGDSSCNKGKSSLKKTKSKSKSKSLITQNGGDGWSVKSTAKCRKLFSTRARPSCITECIKAGKNGDKIIKAPGFGGCEYATVKNQKEKSKRIAEFNKLNEKEK